MYYIYGLDKVLDINRKKYFRRRIINYLVESSLND